MPRASALAACVALLAVPAAGGAGTLLEATADADARLHVVVRNTGDEPAAGVVPELVWEHRTTRGESVALEPAARHEWTFPLPPPPGPGTFPATVRVAYVDGRGRSGSLPLVVLVPPASGAPDPVRATLTIGPLGNVADGRLTLENDGRRPVAGRVVFVLPGGTWTEPESVPAQVPAGGQTVVPVTVRGGGELASGRQPVRAVFEYVDAGEHRTVVAAADVTPGARGDRRTRPLAVGAAALGITWLLALLALRRSSRRRSESA